MKKKNLLVEVFQYFTPTEFMIYININIQMDWVLSQSMGWPKDFGPWAVNGQG